MFDDSRRKTTRFADFPVGGVVIELEREELERQRVKISEGRVIRVPISALEFGVRASWNSALRKNNLAQTRGKI